MASTNFKAGDRIKLLHTEDPSTELVPGDLGTIRGVMDSNLGGTVLDVDWDSGSKLSMILDAGDLVALLEDQSQ